MSIVNLRGTYGSGKTTIARFVMDTYPNQQAHYMEGRKRPLYYTFDHPNSGTPLAVMGSYETVCGGCDTIQDISTIFDTITYLSGAGFDVLYESLLLTNDCQRTVDHFQAGWDLHVIYLDVPTKVCLDSVNMRRRARNPDATDVNPHNLLQKMAGCKSSKLNLDRNGVPTYLLDRAAAFNKVLELFKVETCL